MSLELESPWVRDLYRSFERARATAMTNEHGGSEGGLQPLMVALVVGIGSTKATTTRRGAAWSRAVRIHLAIDRAREVEHARSLDDNDRPLRVVVEPETPRTVVETVLHAFEKHVAAFLASRPLDTHTRNRQVLQARATLRRLVLAERVADIALTLGTEVPSALVSKWIKRGRGIITDTVEWLRETDPELADVYEILAELAAERRTDADRPRPVRRRSSRRPVRKRDN
jgi:hypothetical protein